MKLIAFIAFVAFLSNCNLAQQSRYRFMFYNVENLFDPGNDSLKIDDDFTPQGKLHWTNRRMQDKVNKISKVIIAAGEWQPPVIVGLCEVENRRVLNELVYNSALSALNYKIIHFDSPDERGIDVAMLYDPEKVWIMNSCTIPVRSNKLITRDILLSTVILEKDTIRVFINHWPSRSAGQLETENDRMLAARTLKHSVDSVFKINSKANIIIMGDLNDEPGDPSVRNSLGALPVEEMAQPGELFNLTVTQKGIVEGTLKYQGNWNIFDQIIVSGRLLREDENLRVDPHGYHIFYLPAMLESDLAYNGVKPFRTYQGFRYTGGYSDHLPVFIDIIASSH